MLISNYLYNWITDYIFAEKMSDFEEDDWVPPSEAELKVLRNLLFYIHGTLELDMALV